MKKKSASTEAAGDLCEVYGTVRDEHQQPVAKATVRVHSKSIRSRKLLGEAVTDSAGNYTISYTPQDAAVNAIIAGVYDNKTVLKESDVHYQASARLEVNLDLSGKAFAGISEYDELVNIVTPFTDGVALSEITQTEKEQDISFIIQNTSAPQSRVERLAMAARFETFSSVPAYAWYGVLQQNLPRLNTTIDDIPATDFEAILEITFDALMHTPVDQLINAVELAINENIIAFSVTKELPKISKQLHAQVQMYAQQHLSHLSRLTGNNLPLTEKLVKSKKIKAPADLKKLAALDQDEWYDLINEHKVKPRAGVQGNNDAEKTKQYAAELEAAFTSRYPTAAFSARLQKDKSGNIAHKDPISKFLDQHDDFDLLHTRVGQFFTENKDALPKKDASEMAGHLRRIQRVFKLSSKYATVNTLLGDNIHSAHQVYKMGEEKFLKAYAGRLGEDEAIQVFRKAAHVQVASTAVVANLKSMADASALNAFPNLAKALITQAGPDIPSLDKLFGHTDFFKTTESRSVYGIPAYLTDILHFLDQRLSTLPLTGPRVPTAKDLLLRRRPDIGDLDLGSSNADTEVPYIDIACEIMEDYIAAPVVTIAAATFLPKLVKGVIDATLLAGIKTQFNAAGRSDLSNLLTAKATVSDIYTVEHLQADNTFLVQNNWMIRDKQGVFKASFVSGAANIGIRLSHQTLLPAEAISTGPEYVNPLVYNNFLKTAKRPFSLPFDLFETESGLYLEKLGTKKANLIDIFSRSGPSPLHSPADINMGYASLGINQAEQTLIFSPDISNQSLYWGTDATSTAIAVNTFEKLSGLNYEQIICLLQLQFINPTRNSLIDHDDLSADTSKKRITNITPAKLDAIHRFLRLWRKTTLTMQELDAFIVNMSVQNGAGSATLNAILADQLRNFLSLQQSLALSPFELLAFYGDLNTTHDLPNCQYNLVYQNSAITNPVNPNFSLDAIQAQTIALGDPDKLVICSALQIPLADLNAVLSQTGTASIVTVRTLTVLYRHAKLARALEISVTELLTLLRLINTNPFADTAATFRFIHSYRQMQAFGFSTDDVNYILRHQDNASHTLVPATDQRSAALNQLQSDLLIIKATTTAAADPNGVLLTQWLTNAVLKWDRSLVNRLMDILSTTDDDTYIQKLTDNANFLFNLRLGYQDVVLKTDLPALPVVANAPIEIPASLTAQLSFDAANRQLVLKGVISTADRDALLALSTDATYQAAIHALYNKIVTSSAAGNSFFTSLSDVNTQLSNLLSDHIADRFAFFINKLAPVYRSFLQQHVLLKNISTWFNIDKKLVGIVLQYVPAVFTELTADNFVDKVIDPTTAANPYPVQANRYQFLAKLFFVLRKSNLSVLAQDQALQLFLTNGPTTMGCLDFSALPLTAVDGSVTTFPGFEAILNLLRFDQLYPTRTIPFSTGGAGRYNIFGVLIQTSGLPNDIPSALTQLKNNLAFAYGWSATDLQTLLTANFTVLTDFKAASSIMLRLHQVFTTLQQLGVSLADAQSWCGFSPTASDSIKIKNALKAKYSSSDWLQVTKPLQDSLREKKRDALITYLLANPGTQTWNDANDLFSYFLLDVQMCSCQPTSRIVEASNAVQLFVQRCFLSLESSVVTNDGWQQWTWMKNFRVWQANVKVFLYPENYIEPELLPGDIKSSFLKDLENDLLQNEVTQINAEDAFYSYLQKLEAVARLEVKGTWYDQPAKTLHVFARTYGGNPQIYYHRTFVNDRRWTPWTKIDLDISSDYIIPAMYNNRLYLFWAVFTDVSDKPAGNFIIPKADITGAFSIPVPDAIKKWQIQLAFSEYKNGKWTPKKISENNDSGQLIVTQNSTFKDKTAFVFTALDIPGYDYSKIFNQNGTHVDPTADAFRSKIAPFIRQNGKLVISCYYYNFISNSSFDNNIYVGSFQLDPVKGYPTKLQVPYKIQLMQANKYIERSNRKSIMVNMIDAETFTGASVLPPQNGIPGSGNGTILVADQAGGAFGNVIPMQMDLTDRYNYMNNIYNGALSGTFQFQLQIGSALPYFYQDKRRNYYVVNEYSNNGNYEFLYSDSYELTMTRLEKGTAAYIAKLNEIVANLGLDPGTLPVFISRYYNFHHPLVDYFIQRLFTGGIDGLMSRNTQLKGDFGYDADPNKFSFQQYFQPVVSGFNAIYSGGALDPKPVHNGVTDNTPGYPKDDVDFNLQSGYGLYNWELFFHAPLMIAERLSQNQQFDDAERWYRYIFNPMDTSTQPTPNKYWNTRPFFLTTSEDYDQQRIDSILLGVKQQLALQKNVADWRANPFQPHFIAQYRTVAYQKVAVMKYIGHLVRHGDFLFRQNTMESVNEARQLYILAAEILGPRPEVIPQVGTTALDNYFQLEKKLDDMSDALVDIENLLPLQSVDGSTILPTSPTLQTLYFNIPMNENLAGPTGYWDVVADRLFKIRHCLNIDGTLAPLSLFAPVIDPAALVRAAAAGLDIGAVLSDINSPLPLYRFTTMIGKATELCNEVKALGTAMLSAMEKKDAETMALLRAGHETNLLDKVLLIKQKQIDDAQAAFDSLNKQKELTIVRKDYYSDLIDEGMTIKEQTALSLNILSGAAEIGVGIAHAFSGGASIVPQFVIGVSGLGSPVITTSVGGVQFASAAENAARMLSSIATISDKAAAVMNTISSFDRRDEEWHFQLDLANKELEQLDVQITGAQTRLDLAKQDRANQQLQIDQSKEITDLMNSKFTNKDLFSWMTTQLSNTYFASYQLAYDIAKQSERCFRYELGLDDSAYINFGYWDSLKKGLLAGEQLFYDIKKLEIAFHEQNKRELELTKPISLCQLDPTALLKLKTTGECWINLPEEVFDMDYPGHYMRRIKSVSITIPCISGPYTTVSCKLTMTKNTVRVSGVAASDAKQYPRKLTNNIPADDPRFRDTVGSIQSIATSSAQNDSGLFELNFRDERYLPFEGAGAISMWHLELPAAVRQFDYNTISDVIIHLKYTARDGGDALKANATTSLASTINKMLDPRTGNGLMRIFSAKNDLASEWYRFLNPVNATDDQVLALNLDSSRFPLFAQGKQIKINRIELAADSTVAPVNLKVVSPAGDANDIQLTTSNIYGSYISNSIAFTSTPKTPGNWAIKNPIANARLTNDQFKNLVIIIHYEIGV